MLWTRTVFLHIAVLTELCIVLTLGGYYSEKDTPDWPPYTEADERDCPQAGDRFLTRVFVPWGTEDRAWLTLPPELQVKTSTIPGSGVGIFSRTFIRAYTWVAEYEGEVIHDINQISDYAFKVYRNDTVMHYIDAGNIATSNWSRFINCGRNKTELSVAARYCMGKVFLITHKHVYPGQELFLYYGQDYIEILGLKKEAFS